MADDIEKLYKLIVELQQAIDADRARLATLEERVQYLLGQLELGKADWQKNQAIQQELQRALAESKQDRVFIKELIGLFVDILTTEWGRQIKSLGRIGRRLNEEEKNKGEGDEHS